MKTAFFISVGMGNVVFFVSIEKKMIFYAKTQEGLSLIWLPTRLISKCRTIFLL